MTWELAAGPPVSDRPRPRLVVSLCGVAGSGKTTYAQALEEKGFHRLAVDEEIWTTHGRYGLDYAPEDYPRLQRVAEEAVRNRLADLVLDRVPTVVDLSMWRRADRQSYRALVETHGGHWELVHLVVPARTLRARLRNRAQRFDANAAFPVDDTVLEGFLRGFELPDGEGESRLRWVGPAPV